jgi:type VI secretion system protein ImpK
MHETVANLVEPVLEYGLSLRDRVAAGAALSLDADQAALKQLLQSDAEACRWPDYGGDNDANKVRSQETMSEGFLGIRYALTCWLDELFIRGSPWGNAWAHRNLETSLYGTRDRSWKFWQQAHLAEARQGTDALEAFYLCAMLGFRGEMEKAPEKLRTWIAATKGRLAQERPGAWRPPSGREPATHVPPLRGREKLQRMLLICGMTLLVLVPMAVFFVARNLEQ